MMISISDPVRSVYRKVSIGVFSFWGTCMICLCYELNDQPVLYLYICCSSLSVLFHSFSPLHEIVYLFFETKKRDDSLNS